MNAIARLALSEKTLKKKKKIYETSDQRSHTFQKSREKKWNLEREERLSE